MWRNLLIAVAVSMLAPPTWSYAASPAPEKPAQPDHLILAIRDLDEGIRRFEERTGVRPVFGGDHPGRGTRNALASLGAGLYIEILAPQTGAPAPEAAGLKALADLTPMGWAVAVRDVDAVRRRLTDAGVTLSETRAGSRAKPDGSTLEWSTFGLSQPQIPGMPFFIRWGDRSRHPSLDAPTGCRLERLRLRTPSADDLGRLLRVLGVDVPVETADRGGMEVTLQCPKGAVRFGGE